MAETAHYTRKTGRPVRGTTLATLDRLLRDLPEAETRYNPARPPPVWQEEVDDALEELRDHWDEPGNGPMGVRFDALTCAASLAWPNDYDQYC